MSKNNVLVISECKYSYVGLSVLLKKHYGAYDIRLFSDFMHGGAKAEKITKHDIALIFTSQNLEQSVNVIESPCPCTSSTTAKRAFWCSMTTSAW